MMFKRRILIGLGIVVAATLLKKILPERNNYEEAHYSVLGTFASFEIREYTPRLEARTAVSGEEKKAIEQGFRTLAGYIFGGNQENRQVAMTTPVTYAVDREQTVSFVMPSHHRQSTLPRPNDTSVQFFEVPKQIVAVRRFSGWTAESRWHEERKALLLDLASAGIRPLGRPVLAQYDPPWTIGFLRRNEVLVTIDDSAWEANCPTPSRPHAGNR